jgi:hypothetical protein
MGLMRWLRGGDEDSATASMISAGFASIDALFRPHAAKQTEHIHETKRKRVDLGNASGIDLDQNMAVISAQRGDGTAKPKATRRPYQPPRQSWWRRTRIAMHRRRLRRTSEAAEKS